MMKKTNLTFLLMLCISVSTYAQPEALIGNWIIGEEKPDQFFAFTIKEKEVAMQIESINNENETSKIWVNYSIERIKYEGEGQKQGYMMLKEKQDGTQSSENYMILPFKIRNAQELIVLVDKFEGSTIKEAEDSFVEALEEIETTTNNQIKYYEIGLLARRETYYQTLQKLPTYAIDSPEKLHKVLQLMIESYQKNSAEYLYVFRLGGFFTYFASMRWVDDVFIDLQHNPYTSSPVLMEAFRSRKYYDNAQVKAAMDTINGYFTK